jgi:hypothetical protein
VKPEYDPGSNGRAFGDSSSALLAALGAGKMSRDRF